jgi:DNA repair protein RecO (recombination protein O)
MEEIKVKGVVLHSFDYKEKDKLVEIFTLENGKLMGQLKGCKAPNAKLKFAFQPFCFAEFILAKNGSYYTIVNATLLDSFFDLVNDLETYYLCSLMLELTSICVATEQTNHQLFLNLLTSLKLVCYEQFDVKNVLLKFSLELLKLSGYQLNFENCSVCKLPLLNRKKSLNLDSGSFVCGSCESINSVKISDGVFNTLKIIGNSNFDRLNSIKIADKLLNETIKLTNLNIETRFNKKLKAVLN